MIKEEEYFACKIIVYPLCYFLNAGGDRSLAVLYLRIPLEGSEDEGG